MTAYRVRHKRSGDLFYVLASSAFEAVEFVTLALGDAEGSAAWEAEPGSAGRELVKGTVFDSAGKPITSLEA